MAEARIKFADPSTPITEYTKAQVVLTTGSFSKFVCIARSFVG